MKENRRLFQPLNLIVFLLFVLVAEVTVSLPLFEDANVLLQLAWTGYLLLGMCFLFFVGGKIAAGRNVNKYLGHSETGKFWLGLLLFFICIGAGAAFRLREVVSNSGTLSTGVSLNLLFYVGVSFLVYLIGQQVSGIGGAVAVTIFMALCPMFDFSTKLSLGTCLYAILFLGAILFISLANHSLDVREPGWRDFLLTILGAVALAGATFLHISAVAVLIPCMFFLIRKSGLKKNGKERRILRCFLFVSFYACVTAVIYLIFTLSLQNNEWPIKIPVDHELFRALGEIGKKPENALIALFEKLSGLFTVGNQEEYYNGLLMGMLLLGLIRAILLLKNKVEKKHFPVYLFNCFFLVSILSDEFADSKLLLFALLACAAAGTMADLAEAVIARKSRKLKEEEAEAHKAQEEKKIEEKKLEEKRLEEKRLEEKKLEEQSQEKKAEPILLEMKSENKLEAETFEVPESRKEPERIELEGDAEKGETDANVKAGAEIDIESKAEAEIDIESKTEAEQEVNVKPEKDASLEAALENASEMDAEDASPEAALENTSEMDAEDASLEAALANTSEMDAEDISLEAALENPNVMDTGDILLETAQENLNVMDTEEISLEIALENPNAIDTEDMLFETVSDASNLSDTEDASLEMALENLPQLGPKKIELEYVDLDDEQEMPDVSESERKEEAVGETVKAGSESVEAPVIQMEKQIQELLNREEMLMEIMENQSIQISKLTQELREQRMQARKRERHYRQQFTITRNNRSLLKGKGEKE